MPGNTLSRLFVSVGADTSEFNKKMGKMQKNMAQMGQKMKAVGKKMSMAITGPVVAGFTALTVGTRDFRKTLAPLETNAQQAGVGMDQMSEAMKQMQAITGETDSNVEGLSNLLASGFKDEKMKQVLDQLSGAAIKFKDTMKFETVADGLQETLATGKAIGPFAELLERSGIKLDGFNKGLQQAAENGNKHNYILKTLADTGLSQVYEQYKKNNKELVNSAEANYNLREQLAKLGKKLEPILTKLTNLVAGLVEKFNSLSPGMQKTVGILVGLAAAAGPVLIIFGQIATAISTLTPIIATIGGALSGLALGPIAAVAAAVAGLIIVWKNWDKIVTFVKGFVGMIKSILNPFAKVVKNIFTGIKDSIVKVFNNLGEPVKNIINNYVEDVKRRFNNLKQNIINIFKKLKNSLIKISKNIWNTAKGYVEDFIQSVKNIIGNLVANIKGRFNTIKNYFTNTFSKIKNFLSNIDLFEIGKDIIQGLVNGLKNKLTAPIKAIKDMGAGLLKAIKDKFGIKSPSKEFEKVGKFLLEGMEQGIESKLKSLRGTIVKVAAEIDRVLVKYAQLDQAQSSVSLETPSGAGSTISNNINALDSNENNNSDGWLTTQKEVDAFLNNNPELQSKTEVNVEANYNGMSTEEAEVANDDLVSKLQEKGLGGSFR